MDSGGLGVGTLERWDAGDRGMGWAGRATLPLDGQTDSRCFCKVFFFFFKEKRGSLS